MKKYIPLMCLWSALLLASEGVTNFVVGRLGDRLHFYLEAKWAAKHYGIPFYLTPFPEAASFALSQKECCLPDRWKDRTQQVSAPSDIHPGSGALYTIAYRFQDSDWESPHDICLMKSLIEDRALIEELREAFQPTQAVAKMTFPKGKRVVGIHYRTGVGFDPPDKADYWPFKFLSFEFYAKGLEVLLEALPDEPLYVHIFTDDPEPLPIAQAFQERFPFVEVGCRKALNRHNMNVLDDLYGMASCDYLVRGSSHLGQIAQIIGDHSIVVFPFPDEVEGHLPTLYYKGQ